LTKLSQEIICVVVKKKLDLEDLTRFRRTTKLFDWIANDFNKKILQECEILIYPYLRYDHLNRQEFMSFINYKQKMF